MIIRPGVIRYQSGGAPVPPALPRAANIVFTINPATLTLNNLDPVTSITDSIGGAVFVQETANIKPTYIADSGYGGKPAISFDGTGDRLLCENAGLNLTDVINTRIHTTILVVDVKAARNLGMLFSAGVGANSYQFIGSGSFLGRYSNGTGYSAPTNGRGFFVLAVTSTTTVYGANGFGLERTYINGGCVSSNTDACPAIPTSTAFMFGALTAAGAYPSEFYLMRSHVWDVELTPAEVMQATAALYAEFNETTPWSTADYFMINTGNSITAGYAAGAVANTYPYVCAQSLSLGFGQFSNLGIAGLTQAQMLPLIDGWSGIQSIINKPVKVISFEYYNSRGLPSATLIASINAYAAAVRAIPNTKLCLGTSISSANDPDTTRTAVDDYYDANYADHCDAYIPMHLNATIGLNGADGVNSYSINSATHWADVIHPNATGYGVLAGIVAPIVAAA